MNSDILVQLLQKGFRVTLGATASLIEILQDPQKREENLTKLRIDLTQLTEEWAEKGLVTEQEARSFVDTVLAQRGGQAAPPPTGASNTAAPSASPEAQVELQELTEQIAAIRMELEKLRDKDS
jgi:polyhydroxyalkanoate synthesis regulator phasin